MCGKKKKKKKKGIDKETERAGEREAASSI